jgi:hypothetical protein
MTRGPATLKDFAWWPGLSGVDTKAGLEMFKPQLVAGVIGGQSFWLDPSSKPIAQEITPEVHLLPNDDEYIVSYADRRAIFDPAKVKQVDECGNFLFNHTIVIDGQVMARGGVISKRTQLKLPPIYLRPFPMQKIRR